MNRKVSICTLRAETVSDAANYLKQKISAYSADYIANDYGDAAAFAAGVDASLCNGGIILAAAPVSLFLNAKIRLIKALSSKIVRSSSIINAMGYNAPADPKEADLHAAIPEKAKTLKSADGLYSAFAKEHGNALLIYLPLDEGRLEYMFNSGLSKLLDSLIPQAPQQQAPVAEKPKLSALREHVEAVISRKKTVAVSPCGCAKPLISAISTVPDCEAAFIVDGALRDRLPDESIENYVAQCAKISKENSGTDLGIAVSSIYKDKKDNSDFVVVCVADSDRAKAAKVYALPGEEKKYLVAAAVIRLCEMLVELTETDGLINPEAVTPTPRKWQRNPKLPIIITAAIIAVAAIICVILAFVLGGDKDNEANVANAGIYDFAQQDNYYEDINYHGGSAIDPLELQADAFQSEETTYLFANASTTEQTTAQISTTQAVTKVITTIKNVITTKKTSTTLPVTTKKPTTTQKATTTAVPTTTKATTAVITTKLTTLAAVTTTKAVLSSGSDNTTELTTASSAVGGKFVFKVYGFGHGVGMSQDGAIKMAKNGSSCDEILTHYYTGTTVKTDSATPLTVKYGDKDIPIVEYLCRTTKREIGENAPVEALKAQIITAYTYAKYYSFEVKSSMHAYAADYEYAGTTLHNACLDVLGMSKDDDTPKARYVDYNGSPAFTCYFASAAGKTASSASVWGGNEYPYLAGGVSSPETVDASEVTITAEEMRALINEYDANITLDEDPSKWLEIISHDSSYSDKVGYVTTIRVGNIELRGNEFRSNVVDFMLRSHCFTFEYIPE